jgi:hypothetical protein
MRTTVAIEDRLLAGARQRARARGLTLGQLVEAALRRELATPPAPAATPEVPVYAGVGGLRPGIDVTSNRALREVLDADVDLSNLR